MRPAGFFASDNAAIHSVIVNSVKVSALATLRALPVLKVDPRQPSSYKSVTLV